MSKMIEQGYDHEDVMELEKAHEKAKEVLIAAKALQDLINYKVLHGRDDHYLKSKLRLWSNLELALHNNSMCEASCGFCAFEAEKLLKVRPFVDKEICIECGSASNIIKVAENDGDSISECETLCSVCGHEDYWAHGFFQSTSEQL